jgi:hypothetical protein
MATEAMELTNFHLGRKQKRALKERARTKGTTVAEEIRNAVDAYLSGATLDALEWLDAASKTRPCVSTVPTGWTCARQRRGPHFRLRRQRKPDQPGRTAARLLFGDRC